MSRHGLWVGLAVAVGVLGGSVEAKPGSSPSGQGSRGPTAPLAFVENRGQWDSRVSFGAYRLGATAALDRDGIELVAQGRSGEGSRSVRLSFEGASRAGPRGEDRLETAYHFLLGAARSAAHRGVPAYRSVLYEDLYPGISLRVRGSDDSGASSCLVYDVILEAGAPLEAFRVDCEGIDGMEVLADGRLTFFSREAHPFQRP